MLSYKGEKRLGYLPVWARIVLLIISFLFLGGIFELVGLLALGIPLDDIINEQVDQDIWVLQKLMGLLAAFLVVGFFRKKIDHRTFISIGFKIKGHINDVSLGFLVNILMLGTSFLILILSNQLNFIDFNLEYNHLLKSLLLFTIVAIEEEIIFRGYILNNLMHSMNKYWALIVSSILFSMMHLINPNISFLAIINLFLAGILLGTSYIYTKNLWLPISLHLFWNFIQGPILGFSVSGLENESILVQEISKNNIFNGGEFGFEGSVLCSIVQILTISLLFIHFHKQLKSKTT